MSNKDKKRLLQIIEYLKINESIKKSEAAKVLNVEYKTAQRLLVKATTLEILIFLIRKIFLWDEIFYSD